ncbi:hypothetical protein XENOCAPTIV_011556 [Xenoophorus captivus]|uniref:Uncharacterized protein n=1 Tax=Xenoophorus captivus TaxID=1517983 RepID=A0ABV0R0Y0_9TELE
MSSVLLNDLHYTEKQITGSSADKQSRSPPHLSHWWTGLPSTQFWGLPHRWQDPVTLSVGLRQFGSSRYLGAFYLYFSNIILKLLLILLLYMQVLRLKHRGLKNVSN